ncbi:catalase family protein [Granulicella sibirica]|uniref:catalase n=1 Tax=Granulicella sibirica TaxID=2479048 RepID=A0A4Q0T3K9_9BACT|nr:catalase family protein [Granulicella sibirica]RXH56131.1 Catalase [Granulicella sibirica]
MSEGTTSYLPFSPALEKAAPDEHVIFDELSRTMQHITRTMASHYRHAYRPVHAKSHGVLVGMLEVPPDLPEPLAQGLFAKAGAHPVILRFSTNPGDLLADNVSSPRGLAVKVLKVEGEKLPNHVGNDTQDFVCVNANAFSAPDPKGFLEQIKLFDRTLAVSEGVKHAVSVSARATNAVLKAVHLPSATLEGIGAPATHILGESFSTVAPLRYGNYVAKIGFAPSSESLKKLTGESVDLGADYNALQELIEIFFRHRSAVWDVRVQLALAEDPKLDEKDKDFPIEKADVAWPEEKSPWQTVGRMTVTQQRSYSDARQLFVDEQMSFSPWHGLAAHQPLGGIMRARLKAYEEAKKFRAQRNARVIAEPKSIDEIPA